MSRPPGMEPTKTTGLYSIEPDSPFDYFKSESPIQPSALESEPKNEEPSFKEEEADRVVISKEKESPLFYSVKNNLQSLTQKI